MNQTRIIVLILLFIFIILELYAILSILSDLQSISIGELILFVVSMLAGAILTFINTKLSKKEMKEKESKSSNK